MTYRWLLSWLQKMPEEQLDEELNYHKLIKSWVQYVTKPSPWS